MNGPAMIDVRDIATLEHTADMLMRSHRSDGERRRGPAWTSEAVALYALALRLRRDLGLLPKGNDGDDT